MTRTGFHNSLEELVCRLLEVWPEHSEFVQKSLTGRTPEVTSVSCELADCVFRLADHSEDRVAQLCNDYRFLCEKIILPEEIYFRRHDKYRLSSFEMANRECYANSAFMTRYMNGLLVSNVIWANHANAIASYVLSYLPSLSSESDHLEIGPGHGLFLYFAAKSAPIATASGWDVSPTSIANTRSALHALGIQRPVTLELCDLSDPEVTKTSRRFDSIVMSEILEHVENPVQALRSALLLLRPGGALWVNVPANSPAPDHIFLVESPEHANELVREAGFDIVKSSAFPMTGATLERARRQKLTISCVVHCCAPR